MQVQGNWTLQHKLCFAADVTDYANLIWVETAMEVGSAR